MAAGFCAHGIAGAGGNGQVMAEWIVGGEPPMDLWKMDIRRFGDQYRSRGYALARTDEVYSTYYDIVYPNHERQAGRPLRLPPAYMRHVGLGAELARRAAGSASTGTGPTTTAPTSTRGRGLGRTALVDGHRDRAPGLPAHRRGLFDESSFAKIEVTGAGATAFLQGLCANDIAKRPGSVTYTSMLNSRGGIECDFTVTRLDEDRYLIVTGTAFGRHDLSWIGSHLPAATAVAVNDVTSSMACCGCGARPGRPLVRVCDDDLTFRYMQARRITVGDVPCLALRVTYVGELGWELYPPAEFGRRLWDTLVDAGRPRAGARRLPGHRLPPAGEGLPRLGVRHHVGDRSVLGRPGLRRPSREGRLPGLGRGRSAGSRRRRHASPASCSTTLSVALGNEPVKDGGVGRRARHLRRWPRLLARAVDRVCVVARRAHQPTGPGVR